MLHRSHAVKRKIGLLTAVLAGNVVIPSNTWAVEIVNHDITFSCATSTGQVCAPMYSVFFSTENLTQLKAQYSVPPSHCSSIKTTFLLDGKPIYTSGFLGWANAPLPFANLPLNTGQVNLGKVAEGNHVFSIQAEGQLGGCNTGYLEGWDGRVQIISESSPSACSEITNGLVACYPFDGNANDVSGNNNHGVVYGAIPATDRLGNANGAYQFDGINDYIEIPASTTLDTRQSISIFAWVYSQGNAGPIVNYCTNCWGVHLWETGKDELFVRFPMRNGTFTNHLVAPNVLNENWKFVGATYDYTTGVVKLWVNGIEVNSSKIPQTEVATQYPIRIGLRDGDARIFKGFIDTLSIYNRVLSDAEIKQLAGMNQETGLVAHYCFDDANDIGKDCSTNGNNGVAQGTVSQVPGVRGGAAKFGGINAPSSLSVKNSKSLQFNQELSVSTFVKINNAAGMSYYGARVANGVHALVAKSHDRNGFWFRAALNPSNAFSVEGANNSYASPKTDFAGATTSDDRKDKWVHVAYVISNGVSKLFLDGVLAKTSEASTVDFSIANKQDLYIGKYSDFWYPADASMDDLRLYNRALSDAEIKQLASVTP